MRRLRGDSDAIVLKALAKRPADRYASAVLFAADVRRYLGGDPIESDRPMDRLGRYLERHPFATATVVTLVAAAIELAIQNPSTWAPAFQEVADGLAARTSTMLHWRSDEPSKRSH